MADFRTHLIGGTLAGIGIALAAVGFDQIGWARLPLVALAGVVGGIAPDIDSDSGRPQSILFGVATLVVPTAAVFRIGLFREQEWWGVGAWIACALLVAYPMRWTFQRYTVHRGMFHSTPAILIFGSLCFLMSGSRIDQRSAQIAIGLAGGVGYLVHLVLDELWSVDFEGRKIKVKKSLGTALKPFGSSLSHNLFAWGLALALGGLVWLNLLGRG